MNFYELLYWAWESSVKKLSMFSFFLKSLLTTGIAAGFWNTPTVQTRGTKDSTAYNFALLCIQDYLGLDHPDFNLLHCYFGPLQCLL